MKNIKKFDIVNSFERKLIFFSLIIFTTSILLEFIKCNYNFQHFEFTINLLISIGGSCIVATIIPIVIRFHDLTYYHKVYSIEGIYRKYNNKNILEKNSDGMELQVVIKYLGYKQFEICEEFYTSKSIGYIEFIDTFSGIANGAYKHIDNNNGIYKVRIELKNKRFTGNIWIGWENLYPSNDNRGAYRLERIVTKK